MTSFETFVARSRSTTSSSRRIEGFIGTTPTPLAVAGEKPEQSALWTRETVTFDAADGKDRVRAFLFLPKNAAAPYQTVVYVPPDDAFLMRSSQNLRLHWIDFIIRSGRAFLYPIYLGTFERGPIQSLQHDCREPRLDRRHHDAGVLADGVERHAAVLNVAARAEIVERPAEIFRPGDDFVAKAIRPLAGIPGGRGA